MSRDLLDDEAVASVLAMVDANKSEQRQSLGIVEGNISGHRREIETLTGQEEDAGRASLISIQDTPWRWG